MLHALLVVVYIFIFLYLIRKVRFFHFETLSPNQLSILWVIKVIAGVSYTWIHLHIVNGGDIVHYFQDSQIIRDQLSVSPKAYLHLVFGQAGGEIPKAYEKPIMSMGFWGQPETYFMVRLNALMQLISFGYIYVHAVFFAFIAFIGCAAVAKAFEITTGSKKAVVLVFLAPSILFWTSGMHKESIMTLGLGAIAYLWVKVMHGRFHFGTILLAVLGLAVGLIVRDFVVYLLIGSLCAYYLARVVLRDRPILIGSMFAGILILSMIMPIPGYHESFIETIVNRRAGFLSLTSGNTAVSLPDIGKGIWGFVLAIPHALSNAFIAPFFSDTLWSKRLFVMTAENLLILIMAVTAFYSILRKRTLPSFPLCLLLFAMALIICIGMIVPNLGAITRYKSLALLFLYPSLMAIIDSPIGINNFQHKPNNLNH